MIYNILLYRLSRQSQVWPVPYVIYTSVPHRRTRGGGGGGGGVRRFYMDSSTIKYDSVIKELYRLESLRCEAERVTRVLRVVHDFVRARWSSKYFLWTNEHHRSTVRNVQTIDLYSTCRTWEMYYILFYACVDVYTTTISSYCLIQMNVCVRMTTTRVFGVFVVGIWNTGEKKIRSRRNRYV